MKGKSLLVFIISFLLILSISLAEYKKQPAGWSSSIWVNSGGAVYDWQLANMIKMHIAKPGYANMLFFFTQCYGGGMIDDLRNKLSRPRGDVAFMSAARHDKSSWVTGATIPEGGYYWNLGFRFTVGVHAKELYEEMARTGADAQTAKEIAKNAEDQNASTGWQWENMRDTPQYTSLKKGGKVKIGQTSRGKKVKSHHALLFMGKPDKEGYWNDLEHTRNALVTQGFTDNDMTILAGDGATRWNGTPAPEYVDGKGTKKDLFDAIEEIGKKMNKNEQFIFWVSDHGNRDRTLVYLDKAIKDPVKQKVPSSVKNDTTWKIDKNFKNEKKLKGTNAWVSLFVDTRFEKETLLCPCFKCFLNGRELKIGKKSGIFKNNDDGIEEIYAYDDDPDLDGYELIYPVEPKRIKRKNTIEFEFIHPGHFTPFTLLGACIGISRSVAAPEEE